MNVKSLLPHLAAAVIFFATVFILFTPEFSGKTLRKGDMVAYNSSIEEARKYGEKLGERMNWTGTSFAGMPTYQMSTISEGNQLSIAAKATRVLFDGGPGYFLAICVSAYLGLILMGVNPWLSIAGAVGVAFATNNLVLWQAGHLTKVATISYFPLIIGGIVAAFRKRYILGGLVFALGMGLAIYVNHPQMLYYFGLTVPIYGIAKLVEAVRAGEFVHFGKALGALVVGLLLALGAGASNVLPTQEYSAATMRGGQVLETPIPTAAAGGAEADPGDGKPSGSGLEWDYAMQWSNGFKDMLATYSPLAAGGGTGEMVEGSSTFGKAMRKAGFPIKGEFNAPVYHGSLPFTEGPIYLGAVVWALFIFGLFTARRALAAWFGLGTLLIFLMSTGSSIEGFNRFLFDNLPLLNKFRTPNSALSVSVVMMLSLGILGLHDWWNRSELKPEAARKQLLYAGATAGALGLIFAVVLPFTLDFAPAGDAATLTQYTGGRLPDVSLAQDALVDTRREMFVGDAWRSFLFVGLTFGVLFMMYRKTFTPLIGGLALAALLAMDFQAINKRYIGPEDWTPEYANAKSANPTEADRQILADPDIHYRVLNVTGNTFADPTTSYFHKSVGGYSAVKLRRYQDLIDGYLYERDQDVINMLNTKYFIVPDEEGTPAARRNPGAYGPAWLASNVKIVSSNDAEFAALGEVEDLNATAIVHEDFADVVNGLQPSGQGAIKLKEYVPNKLVYDFSSKEEQLVVFSEIWYGPDLGWEAFIDGQPAELIRTNYLLRGLRVPPGQHELVMSFNPSSYALGVTISFVCSILILLGLIGYAAYTYLVGHRLRNTSTPIEEMPAKKV